MKNMSKSTKPQLIVALDVSSLAETRELVDQLSPVIDIFKVGSQLFTACGPAAVRYIEAKGKKVFLDLKFHDIPNTVASAVNSAVEISVAVERSMDKNNAVPAGNLGLLMFTLHTCGGLEMMAAAAQASAKAAEKNGLTRPFVVGVTVLTSEAKKDNIQALVLDRAKQAQQAGLDGVVASCHEARMLRQEFGDDFLIVTPGIRPQGADVQDQKRIATPKEAVTSGSNFLVVGRPIVQADDPLTAAKNILNEINQS